MDALVGLDLLKKNRQGEYSLTESAAFLQTTSRARTAFFSQLVENIVPMRADRRRPGFRD